jgi:hypothetical protein
MLRPLFRPATLSLLTLLSGCEFRRGAEEVVAAAPTAQEEEVLNVVLADTHEADASSCFERVVRPTTVLFWPGAMSFGDGKLSYTGDERYDEIAALEARAKTVRSVSLRMPDQAARRGFRVVENASTIPSCRARFALHSPLFDGGFAVVATDVQIVGVAGGTTHVRVLRRRGGRWQSYAFGVSSWGRPVI